MSEWIAKSRQKRVSRSILFSTTKLIVILLIFGKLKKDYIQDVSMKILVSKTYDEDIQIDYYLCKYDICFTFTILLMICLPFISAWENVRVATKLLRNCSVSFLGTSPNGCNVFMVCETQLKYLPNIKVKEINVI